MNRYLTLLLLSFIFTFNIFSQNSLRIEPPYWWTGFKNPSLQLMIHGKDIGLTTPVIKSEGIIMKKINRLSNKNYLFLDLVITENIKPGTFNIHFEKDGKEVSSFAYKLLPRKEGSSKRVGFSSEDVIYLLMPDRFANGDTSNDSVPGMFESCDRRNPDARHGGDIKGITEHLDYLKNLGVTALWSTPVLENNMQKYSYHGYSITDHYKVDPRLGTNNDYFELSDQLHKRGMKLIMDMVFNHCGLNHWWMKDLPSDDWIHQFPEFTRTSYRVGTVTDPYASKYDSLLFEKGWFDKTMPDLNQENPFLAKYLIQNSIWWIEAAGVDGIRVDTYPYCDKKFMSDWGITILNEYPDLNITGECWAVTPGTISYWQKDSKNKSGYNSYLPSVIDFAMYDALRLGFMEPDGWNTGIFRLYDILSQDFVYADPQNILTFLDNHDVRRYLASQDQDIDKLKRALVFLLTSRGIPQIFYGTEALLTTTGESSDGKIRMDMPGGWKDDSVNVFTGKNIPEAQQQMKAFLQKLLAWRKDKSVIHHGKLTHFLPVDDVYVYFRHNDKETVMIAINHDNEKEKTLDRSRYREFLDRYKTGTDVLTGKHFSDLSVITVPPKGSLILDLEK